MILKEGLDLLGFAESEDFDKNISFTSLEIVNPSDIDKKEYK